MSIEIIVSDDEDKKVKKFDLCNTLSKDNSTLGLIRSKLYYVLADKPKGEKLKEFETNLDKRLKNPKLFTWSEILAINKAPLKKQLKWGSTLIKYSSYIASYLLLGDSDIMMKRVYDIIDGLPATFGEIVADNLKPKDKYLKDLKGVIAINTRTDGNIASRFVKKHEKDLFKKVEKVYIKANKFNKQIRDGIEVYSTSKGKVQVGNGRGDLIEDKNPIIKIQTFYELVFGYNKLYEFLFGSR